jgi:hypothetical protein
MYFKIVSFTSGSPIGSNFQTKIRAKIKNLSVIGQTMAYPPTKNSKNLAAGPQINSFNLKPASLHHNNSTLFNFPILKNGKMMYI